MGFSSYSVVCLVDGKVTPYERYQTTSGKDQIGDATVAIRRPLAAHVTTNTGGGLNAPNGKKLQLIATASSWTGVVGGVRQNLVVESGTIFRGTILSHSIDQDPAQVVTLYAQDDLWRMAVSTTEPQAWDGPIAADKLIRGLFSKYGYGALPVNGPVATLEVLMVVPLQVRYGGVTRTMNSTQQALAHKYVDQFPGLIDVATAGRLRVNVRAVFRSALLDIDAYLSSTGQSLPPYGSGVWVNATIGKPMITNQYGGADYDALVVMISEQAVYSGAFGLTQGASGWSFINLADGWYTAGQANNTILDGVVHEFSHQIEARLQALGKTPRALDAAGDYGFMAKPVRNWMDWYTDWHSRVDYSLITTPGPVTSPNAAATAVPRTYVAVEQGWLASPGALLPDPAASTANVLGLALDALRFPDGSGLTLGGVDEIDEGQVILRARQNRLAFVREIATICGYSVFSTPSGVPRMCRTMGIPPAVGTTDLLRADGGYRVISESDDTTFRIRGARDGQVIVNYVEVTGASFQEEDGTAIDIRSFPLQSPVIDPLLIPADVQFKQETFSSSLVTTQQQANGAREIREQDLGGVASLWTVDRGLMPTLYPGHVVKLVSPTNGLNATHYVERVGHQGEVRGGHSTSADVRRGAGVAQPAGVDRCLFVTILSGTTHIGDEYRANYVVPSPFGLTRDLTFNPGQVFGSVSIVASAHGTNSQLGAGGNVGLEGSKIELIQLGENVGSAPLPVLDEDLNENRNYTLAANRTDIEVSVGGTYKSGVPITLRITSANGDDFELGNIRFKTCEQGQPLPPFYPRPPGSTPTPPRVPGDTTAPGAGTGGRPDRPARVVLLSDGVAKPGKPALFTATGFVLPQGKTLMFLNATFTGLTAAAGTYGPGMKEYAQVTLRTSSGTFVLRSQIVRLPADGGGVAAGSGPRNMSFDVTAACAFGAAVLVPEASGIFSESATVGVTRVVGTRPS